MNKFFNKLRKNRGLSMFLALAMLISLLPFNTVLAETGTDGNISSGAETVSPNEVVASEDDEQVETLEQELTKTPSISTFAAETEATQNASVTMKPAPTVTYKGCTNCYTVATDVEGAFCTVSYENAPASSWSNVQFTIAEHDVRYYDKMVIKLTPSRETMHLQFQSQSGWLTDWTATSAEGGQPVEIPLETDITELMICFDSIQGYTGTSVTATIESITFIASENPPTGEEDTEVDPNAVPAVTKITATDGADDVTDTVKETQEDVFAAVSYHGGASWGPNFTIGVEDHTAKYSKMIIDFTPSWDNMIIGIRDDANTKYRDHWSSSSAVTSGDRQTIEIDNIARDITSLKFYLDPNNADITENVTLIIHSIKFIDPNASTESSGPQTMAEISEIECESGYGFKTDDKKTAVYDTGNQLRVKAFVPDDYTFTVGDVVTINYKTNMSDIEVYYGWKNSSPEPVKFTDNNGKLTASETENSLSYTVSDVSVFADMAETDKEFIHFKSNSGTADSYLTVTSITITRGAEEEPEEEETPAVKGPVVTFNSSASNISDTTVESDGTIVAKYAPGIGLMYMLSFDVTGSDYKTYSKVEVDITPSWSGMNFGVWDNTGEHIVSHYTPNIVETGERHVISFDLPRDVEELILYFDAADSKGGAGGAALPEGEQTVKIHSVKIVDPNALPESKAKFTGFEGKVRGTNNTGSDIPLEFTVNEGSTATFNYAADNNYTRLYANFTDYTYKAGDVLVVVSDHLTSENFASTNASGQVFIGYSDSNGDYIDVTKYAVDGEGWFAYTLPEGTFTSGNQPTKIRFKGNLNGTSTTIKGIYIWDAATFKEFNAAKYDPDGVPQGIAVTYYDDIYSRGVAWNTKDLVPLSGEEDNAKSALYYVEVDANASADDVDWADTTKVKKVDATGKAYTAVQGKTSTVWHTFKAVADDLNPGAKYFFRVGCEEFGWSKVGSFTVEGPEDEIDSLHFIHLTDTQEEEQSRFKQYAKVVADAYANMPNAAFMAHTGDHVNNGEKEDDMRMEEWMMVLDEPKANLMNSVLMPTTGNHDCGKFVFTDRFNINWADYIKDSTDDMLTGGCYSFTYGKPDNGVLIISLNTNELWNERFVTYQQPWLEKTLEENKDYKWKIVQMHAGAITGGGHTNDGESKHLRSKVMPIFAKYEVDLVLQGHDHWYTRSRSMAYGENPFEEGEQYFDGHTPVYLSAVKEKRVVNGKERDVYIEPKGTHYITINASGGKRYDPIALEKIDPLVLEAVGENPFHPDDELGKGGSMCQLAEPAYGLISIEGDLLVYDTYLYSSSGSELYDTFAIDKGSDRGYDPENPHDGKSQVQLYGIKVESKKYDGHPVKLDLSGFNCSNPSIMDTASLKYDIETISGGVDPATQKRYEFHPSNLIYGMMPKEPGTYRMTISVPQSNKDFYGEVVFDFTISQ